MAEDERRKLIARRMLRDGPPHRIRLKHLFWEYQSLLRMKTWRREVLTDDELMPYCEENPPNLFDLAPFELRRKNVVNVLAAFLSKSAPMC